MTEPENFVARWTRLKHESRTTVPASTDQVSPDDGTAQSRQQPRQPLRPTGQPPLQVDQPPLQVGQPPLQIDRPATTGFEPTSLPAIESIATETDIRPFLEAGVPAQLVRAALRAAWAVDPAIRDFIGIAETQWDFNDPTAMEGFGPLDSTEIAASLLARSMSSLGKISKGGAQSDIPEAVAQPTSRQRTLEHSAAQQSGVVQTTLERATTDSVGALRARQVDMVWLSSSMAQETPPSIETELREQGGSQAQPDVRAHPPTDSERQSGTPRRHGGALPRSSR